MTTHRITTSVLISGSGSAGLCAALWLSRLKIPYMVLEKRSGPLKVGQADGVQCRTVEVFESFGLDSELVKTAYHVSEVCFWSSPEEEGKIKRTGRTADVPEGLSHKPHVIMNQARLNGLMIGEMGRAGGEEGEIVYGVEVRSVRIEEGEGKFPVTVVAEKDGVEVEYRAKYLLGCDGAHSAVRRSLGYKMIGDSSDAVWGVMDIFPDTDFPDIRKKSVIRSKAGSLLIIPREGDEMVRFYLELPHGTDAKKVKLEDLQETAKNILCQYKVEIKHTFWWSAYAIGQRLVDYFSKDNRIFLTGDACHTHSPKAGQGMNMSLQDGYNIGWKLAYVLKGLASPDLLKTYNLEREELAKELITFDREFTQLFSSTAGQDQEIAAKVFAEHFSKSLRYTAGLMTKYADSSITSLKGSEAELAKNVIVGMRLPSAQVVRLSDARAVPLTKLLLANGRWRIIVFAGDILEEKMAGRLAMFSESWAATGYSHEIVESILVLSGSRTATDDAVVEGHFKVPAIFTPKDGEYQLSFHHKIVFDDVSYNDGESHAYELYGVDPAVGAIVIVRPDQYVSMVTSLDDIESVKAFFGNILTKKSLG